MIADKKGAAAKRNSPFLYNYFLFLQTKTTQPAKATLTVASVTAPVLGFASWLVTAFSPPALSVFCVSANAGSAQENIIAAEHNIANSFFFILHHLLTSVCGHT